MYHLEKLKSNLENRKFLNEIKYKPKSSILVEKERTDVLTYMHDICICIHMRTTINIDDQLLKKAAELTGIKEKTSLVREGLNTLIALESSKRLAKLGGTEKDLANIPRRKAHKK